MFLKFLVGACSAGALAFAYVPPAPLAGSAAGPGAVLELQRNLAAALDAGSREEVEKLVDGQARAFFLVDADGRAARYADREAALAAFPHWLDDGEGGWTTKILGAEADCPSGELSYVCATLERTRGAGDALVVRRYRSTALVRWKDGAMRLFHWHVSPEGAEDPR